MSLRWRLSLSYGVISLLVITSLGMLLFFALRSYYQRQASNYLDGNAEALGSVLETLIFDDQTILNDNTPDYLQAALDTYAFLLQAQITIYDPAGHPLAQSSAPAELQAATELSLIVTLDGVRQEFGQNVTMTARGPEINSYYALQGASSRISSSQAVIGPTEDLFASPLALMETPGLAPGLLTPTSSARATYVARTELRDISGAVIGFLELSDGPAFGQEVLTNVAAAFLLAGLVALLLSAVTGLILSRQLNRPIQALAHTTARMANGDLSARSQLQRRDEIGQLAQAFNEMAARVEQLVNTLRRFVADAAHELNTPLTALRTNLELATRAPDSSPALAQAEQQLDRLTQLGDNLLALSRLESAVNPTNPAVIDLAALLAQRAEFYAARAEQANLDLALTLPPGPLLLAGYELQLQQILDNLVDNGIKFTPAGGQILLELTQQADTAIFTITDTGIGLAGADPVTLLERFKRGPNAVNTPGSGLGLAIVRAAIRLHKGQIEIRPQKSGTQACVTLPIGNVKANRTLMTTLVQDRAQ